MSAYKKVKKFHSVSFFSIFSGILYDCCQLCSNFTKIYHKSKRNLSLVVCIFTKFSEIMCLISTHISEYRHAKCDYRLQNSPGLYCILLCEFSLIIDDHSYLKSFIFTKLSKMVCRINTNISLYLHARCDSILWQVFYLIDS